MSTPPPPSVTQPDLPGADRNGLSSLPLPLCLALLLLASVIMMTPQLLADGATGVVREDILTYGRWARQFMASLSEGTIIPRWMPDDFNGFGSPAFQHYPPLAFYLAAFFTIFTDSIILSMKLVKTLALFFTASGIFLLLRRYFSPAVALSSSLFFISFPYTVSQYYLFSSYSSVISFAWYCPILLLLLRHDKSRNLLHLLGAGLMFGLLILTHVIGAYMFLLMLIPVLLIAATRSAPGGRLLPIIVTTLSGGALSAYYLVPAFDDLSIRGTRTGGIPFSDQFLFSDSPLSLHAGWSVYYAIFENTTLVLMALVALLTTIVVKCGRQPARPLMLALIAVSLASLFLLCRASLPLWETIPFMTRVGYPARWIMVLNMSVALLSASGFRLLEEVLPSKRSFFLATAIMVALCLPADTLYIRNAPVIPEAEMFASPGVDWLDEYLPATVDRADSLPLAPVERLRVVSGCAETELVSWRPEYRHIRIRASEPSLLRLGTFFFPAWKAELDGTPWPLAAEGGSGAQVIQVPSGHHDLVIRFGPTTGQRGGLIITLVSLVLLVVFLLRRRLRAPCPAGDPLP